MMWLPSGGPLRKPSFRKAFRDFDDFLGDRVGDGFVVLFQALKVTGDGIPNVRNGFLAGLALRNAAR